MRPRILYAIHIKIKSRAKFDQSLDNVIAALLAILQSIAPRLSSPFR